MELYIFLGSTMKLEDENAGYYQGFAFNHFEEKFSNFKKAFNEVKNQKTVKVARAIVKGNEKSDIHDIVQKVTSQFGKWQPSLKRFDFNVNHFYVGGNGMIKSSGKEFK